VELEQLLPRAAAILHHGGLGTTARALQAGIPQVISPIGFDQPDNGHRVELLGAGRVVPRDRMSGATFAAAVREQVAEPEQALKLARYRAALQGSRAVERAADLLLLYGVFVCWRLLTRGFEVGVLVGAFVVCLALGVLIGLVLQAARKKG
jgi:UDP:flavonoid glycosyltransferase YjiC (YdhE family)